ncbi:hypothetical protein ACFP53_26480 [Streptomyces zhihengii]|uniref:PE-PGRS family protein n=2 Tax=Streptomyces zhihengii TaxID=1818004 RepID=A0ABS2V4H5_9ACTN|nr:hypothetical protein [Streptomyces zhihengii]MBM9624741.1 hypothetical protein [Streptomyces zhihengii]
MARTYTITRDTAGAVTGIPGTEPHTVTGDPVEALMQWARLDRPGLRYRVQVDGSPGLELPVQNLLWDAARHRREDPAREAGVHEAVAGWLRHHSRPLFPEELVGGFDPLALQRAGQAWMLRTQTSVPSGALAHLPLEDREQVRHGAREMGDALHNSLARGGPGPRLRGTALRELHGHWQRLAGAAQLVPEATGPARKILDRLITSTPDAPHPPAANAPDADLRTAAARIWWLAREHQPDLAQALRRVADPAAAGHLPRPLFTVLPDYLRHHPHMVDDLLHSAEALGNNLALHDQYTSYPDSVRRRFSEAVDVATLTLGVQGAAVAMAANAAAPAPRREAAASATVRLQAHTQQPAAQHQGPQGMTR